MRQTKASQIPRKGREKEMNKENCNMYLGNIRIRHTFETENV